MNGIEAKTYPEICTLPNQVHSFNISFFQHSKWRITTYQLTRHDISAKSWLLIYLVGSGLIICWLVTLLVCLIKVVRLVGSYIDLMVNR